MRRNASGLITASREVYESRVLVTLLLLLGYARILIIDDDKQIRNAKRMLFKRFDHEVVETSNGTIGMDIYGEIPKILCSPH